MNRDFELFDKQYVYFMWDDELIDKYCFVADTIDDLRDAVNDFTGYPERIVGKHAPDYPFQTEGTHYVFAYYDPNYNCKYAYKQGKTIQAYINCSDSWIDSQQPTWDSACKFRIKPDDDYTLYTYKQLIRWLATGNGMIKDKDDELCSTTIAVVADELNSAATRCYVRKWNDNAWHEPSVAYLGEPV